MTTPRPKYSQLVLGVIALSSTATVAGDADYKAIRVSPAATQTVSPPGATSLSPQPLPPKDIKTLPSGNPVQTQKLPAALPQTNSPATLPANAGMPAVKPVGNLSAVKTIQYQKGVTNIDFRTEPDSTVLVGPKGEKTTAGEVKKLLSNPLTNEVSQKLNASNVQINATSNSRFSIKNKAFSLPVKAEGGDIDNKSKAPPANKQHDPINPVDAAKFTAIPCANETKQPKVLKVRGTVTPGSKLTIVGECFGDIRSEVRITGANIKGIIRLQPDVWGSNFIAAAVPNVSGITEGPAELEVITSESRRSIEYPVIFVPTYELHNGIKKFSGCKEYSDENNKRKCGAGSIQHTSWVHTNFVEHAKYDKKPPVTELAEAWGIDVNPACKLDEIKLTGYGPEVDRFTAYIDPTNQSHGGATIRQTFRTTYEEHWYGDVNWYNGYAAVSASAYCPVGIAP